MLRGSIWQKNVKEQKFASLQTNVIEQSVPTLEPNVIEQSANHYRKDWIISEMVAIKRAIEAYERQKAKERQKDFE